MDQGSKVFFGKTTQVVYLNNGKTKSQHLTYLGPPFRVLNFSPQVCFWWLSGTNFTLLEDSGIGKESIWIDLFPTEVTTAIFLFLH